MGKSWLFLIVIIGLTGHAFAAPVVEERIPDLGRFEFRKPDKGMEGVIIGASHGETDRKSDRLARAVSDQTGAGLVVAYGFKSKRLSVTQPVAGLTFRRMSARAPLDRGSVFREYRKIVVDTANGELDFYVGLHHARENPADTIDVATAGLTFEQAQFLKDVYIRTRDRFLVDEAIPKLGMALDPLDQISWKVWGVKHHGVLLIAKTGLNLRIPDLFLSPRGEELYAKIFSLWIKEAIRLFKTNPLGLPRMQVKLVNLGRFELIQSRERLSGIVLGAPHGTYDEHTAELVKRIGYLTGMATVIAKGFTPTETGGLRINVNRPTEKSPYSDSRELHSQRAEQTYAAFRDLVFKAASGNLNLYIDVHQYSTENRIQVATVGISRQEAGRIKKLYYEIRNGHLNRQAGIEAADLVIEPVDQIEIPAWAAKAEGILSLAKKSLHFELPYQEVLATPKARDAYARILAILLKGASRFIRD
ncbi:MAG: hypothetical protein HY695_25290 [Deltaproteobacteria bacterium]|nr:hypothetical protein [Deltaproteobacteria bacterium]